MKLKQMVEENNYIFFSESQVDNNNNLNKLWLNVKRAEQIHFILKDILIFYVYLV